MRRAHKHLVLFALLTLFAGLGITASQTDTGSAQTVAPPPNILFIVTDDMNASDLDRVALDGRPVMFHTQNLLENEGVKFTNAFVTRSLCCPSRATILRGQYTHNHNVWVNVEPQGGFPRFRELGHESSTIATWLVSAGYDTILIGKYLNRYGNNRLEYHIAQGWDKWYAWEGMYTGTDSSYKINENGTIETYQRSKIHDTDLHAQTAEDFIRNTAGGAPFFMYLAPNAPHKPAYSAKRHANMFKEEPLPKPPSFNEADVSDKPTWVRNRPRLSSTQVSNITTTYRKRLRALQSVDEMVERLVNALKATGELSNTYIVFTSDNGDYLGEHRLQEKAAVYEEAIHIPLLIRGPGVPSGVKRPELVLNNDLAPTLATWAHVQPANVVDGRPLSPLLSTSSSVPWRSAFLIEHKSSPEEYDYVRRIPEYYAVRTSQYLYVEYLTTPVEKEFYDLSADPYQLTNTYNSVEGSRLLSDLQARLAALKQCIGTGPSPPSPSPPSCEAAEGT